MPIRSFHAFGEHAVIFQGHKPAMLFKLAPEEIPDYHTLKSRRVIDYVPKWKQRELEEESANERREASPAPQGRVSITKQRTERTETRRDTERKPTRKSRAGQSRQERKSAYEPPPELEYDVGSIAIAPPPPKADIPNNEESRTELKASVPEETTPAADGTEIAVEDEPLGMVECSPVSVLGFDN